MTFLRGIIPAVWVSQGSCFSSTTWLVVFLSDLIATMTYTCVTYYKPCDLKTAGFQNGGHMSELKSCCKFLFVDRIKIFADIGYFLLANPDSDYKIEILGIQCTK